MNCVIPIISFCYRILLFSALVSFVNATKKEDDRISLSACYNLQELQYVCQPPVIDSFTQQPSSCQPDNSIIVECEAAPGINCDGLLNGTNTFHRKIRNACSHNAHIHYSKALILSIFCGLFGIDRFYLGYYAIGMAKLLSLGGLFIFWLVDVVLIALQLLEPADGTKYIMNYYGPKVTALRFDEVATNYSYYSCVDCL